MCLLFVFEDTDVLLHFATACLVQLTDDVFAKRTLVCQPFEQTVAKNWKTVCVSYAIADFVFSNKIPLPVHCQAGCAQSRFFHHVVAVLHNVPDIWHHQVGNVLQQIVGNIKLGVQLVEIA